jgi:hypothetical protein
MAGVEEKVPPQVDADSNGSDTPVPAGPLDAIRAQRNAIAKKTALTLLVPGYNGLCAVKYHALPKGEIDALVTRIQKANEKGELMAANADLLIRCCTEILGRGSDDAEWGPVIPGETTTFASGPLAKRVGVEAEGARDEVYALFAPDGQQPMAHGAHAGALSKWLGGSLEEIEQSLLGE